jgi:indolepyruvate ferredoxin oxidoreductase
MILGYAWQKGWVPLTRASLLRAIELNNVQVDNNKAAFEWGRQAAHDSARVEQALAGAGGVQVIEFKPRETLESIIARRVEYLTGYQNAAYAEAVPRLRRAGAAAGSRAGQDQPERSRGALPVQADGLQGRVRGRAPAQRSGLPGAHRRHVRGRLQDPLPPGAAHDGRPQRARASWSRRSTAPACCATSVCWMGRVFRLLAGLKGLRGGALDVFGKTDERQTERALIEQYRASIEEVLASLSADNHATAVEIARIPEAIKGFGHVKERHLKAARARWDELLAQYRQPAEAPARQLA